MTTPDMENMEDGDLLRVADVMRSAPAYRLERDLAPVILEKIHRKKRFRFTLLKLAACLILAVGAGGLFWAWQKDYPIHAHKTNAVDRSLKWLAEAQDPSGAWSAEKWGGQKHNTIGLTGLALMCFISRDDSRYKPVTDRAITWLLRQQKRKGNFGPPCISAMYNHGITTVALLKAFSHAPSARLKAPITQALAYIRAAQGRRGGWGYRPQAVSENVSVSVWQLQALILARRRGWEKCHANIEKAVAWLKSTMDETGRFGYRRPGDFPDGPDTLTAMGAWCLLSRSSAPNARTPLHQKMKHAIETIALKNKKRFDYYQGYFLASAMDLAKGGDSSSIRLEETLLNSQVASGPNRGSWAPTDRWSSAGGRIYTTAMATLSLQASAQNGS